MVHFVNKRGHVRNKARMKARRRRKFLKIVPSICRKGFYLGVLEVPLGVGANVRGLTPKPPVNPPMDEAVL